MSRRDRPSSPKSAPDARPGASSFNPAAPAGQQTPGGIAHDTGELYRLLVESVQDYAIFALDPHGYILSWNPGAERFKGYRADEIIGKHFSIFYLPERIAEGFPEYELREAARVGRFEDEGWRVRKNGTRFWANVVITALRDSTGQLVGYAKVTRDLSDRRAAEEALRESEERFRVLVQGVKDYAIFMLDPTGHVATWNEGAERIKGYTKDEIIGQHFSIFYPKDDVTSGKPARELEIASATGTYEEEGWRIRKDGTRLWASVLITALRNDAGRLIGFSKVTRDLTERRAAAHQAMEDARRVAAEAAARREAELSRARTEQLQNITAELSAAHDIAEIARVIFANGFTVAGVDAGALALVDASADSVTVVGNRRYEEVGDFHRVIRIDDTTAIGAVIRSGSALVYRSRAARDARFPRLAKVLAPYEATAVLPLSVQQRTIGALAMHSVSEGSLTESSLEFMRGVAQQVAQAGERAGLYEAEQHARLRADDANRAKSEFLAAMSHELRTPLNAISGYAELIDMGLRGPVTQEQHDDLQRIKRSQRHLLGIINDILNFARIEAGQIPYAYASVSLSEVLEAVGSMIAPQAAAKGLNFTISPCPGDIVAWADKAKVEQIVLNLLSNAVKFTAEGSVTLSCGWNDGDQVELTVRDTGAGIPANQLEKIFEPFVQVGRSFTSSREGTGLGLAISRDLARAMAGDVTVQSAEGNGSTFTLVLPRTSSAGS